MTPTRRTAATLAALAATLAGCGSDDDGRTPANTRPAFVVSPEARDVDGTSDDLLTAGLGAAGLQSATAPLPANAAAPTAGELRRLAIYNNYRALVDVTAAGGYGTLYGPTVGAPAVGP
jgi:hydroxybutyrate-dimer hydrolase